MRVTNKYNLPAPVVNALTHDEYTRGESNRSVSQLIDSPQYRILKKEHRDQITYDASELIWIALGKGVHHMFENHGGAQNYLPEQRLFAEILGWTISGQMDLQEVMDKKVAIFDYKVTSVWSLIFGKDKYVDQLNFYAWLARRNGYEVESVNVIFVLRDWRKSDADKKGKDYPQAPIVVVPMELWDEEKCDAYVHDRVEKHQDAEMLRLMGAPLPKCTDDERWVRDKTYAVKKDGNKTAVRGSITPAKSAAERMASRLTEETGKKHYVETRGGEPIRCAQGWCPVADYCDQWQAERKDWES